MVTRDDQLIALEYLQRAAEEPHGLELEFLTNIEAAFFRDRLAQARKEHGEYQNLAFVLQGHKLWLVKKEPANAEGD